MFKGFWGQGVPHANGRCGQVALLRQAPMLLDKLGNQQYDQLRLELALDTHTALEGVDFSLVLPTRESVRAGMAKSMRQGMFRNSYGHRRLNRGKKRGHGSSSNSPSCATDDCDHQPAKGCSRGMCALCCDAMWWDEQADGGTTATACKRHQGTGGPDSLGGCLLDEYATRVDCAATQVADFINGPGDTWFPTQECDPRKEVVFDAVLWTDGGRSGGQSVVEWCFVLVDDEGDILPTCTVSQLTRASFCRFITSKARCDAQGLASTVGPLLRSVVDLAMHGVVHKRTGKVVRVQFPSLVGDMEALVHLVGKSIGTPQHCAWCDAALSQKGAALGSGGPWGDLATGCGAGCVGVRPMGEWMRQWRELVLPLVQQGGITTDYRKKTDGINDERPCLYRYKEKPTTTSPSSYGAAAAARQQVSAHVHA